MKLPNLSELLKYKHPHVFKLYNQNYPRNTLSAEIAFQETLKYLWLVAKHSIELACEPSHPDFPANCVMLISMREIDEMWHEFILFTEDYTQFCNEYFGEYIHHYPNIFDTMPLPRDVVEREVAKLLPYVYDNLGPETMKIWFNSYLEA